VAKSHTTNDRVKLTENRSSVRATLVRGNSG
jgi:hypothetical protein